MKNFNELSPQTRASLIVFKALKEKRLSDVQHELHVAKTPLPRDEIMDYVTLTLRIDAGLPVEGLTFDDD